MVRGRTTGRGTRRGAAAAGSRSQPQSVEPNSTTASSSATPASGTPAPAETSATPSRSTPSASMRGAASTRATRGPAAGRFRPKVVRRDEAERDTLARLEEEKANERAKEERRARGRSRFRSKRSRGDAMGARRIIGGASGPFASGTAGKLNYSGFPYISNLTYCFRRRRRLVWQWWRWWWIWRPWWRRRRILKTHEVRIQGLRSR